VKPAVFWPHKQTAGFIRPTEDHPGRGHRTTTGANALATTIPGTSAGIPIENPPPTRRGRRIPVRLSVRTLMLLVLAVGGGLAWVVHRAHIQRDAVAAIEKAGGGVVYAFEWEDGHPATPGPIFRSLRWLVDACGVDYFSSVAAVSTGGGPGARSDDALMAHVGRLGRLEDLNLYSSPNVTDAGLAHLRRLTALRRLDLSFTGATGAGLRHLKGMTRLKKLELPPGRVTDDDLAHLEGLKHLEWLQGHGSGFEVTDAGMAHLQGLVSLEMLSIPAPRITSAGLRSLHDLDRLRVLSVRGAQVRDLAPIRHLAGLESLNLTSNPLDDVGLAPVAGFTQLKVLYLDGTRVTDAGMPSLAGLSELQTLQLNGTSVGDAGLSRLAGLDKLNLLFVEGTLITDAGISHLNGLKSCTQVAVGNTAVTHAGIAAAQQARPQTMFIRMVYH